ncbi:hypothetical protein ACH4VX_09315 [Streptomyces sp. NPDC020731]|uniref:hypothetical protein n=1 Tax=Streptomyces sp. NPDC020731 TaxID=3365085 RepID=UPI0037A9DE5E
MDDNAEDLEEYTQPEPYDEEPGSYEAEDVAATRGGTVAADADPDVFLDVPVLKVDEIDLDVEDLRAHVSLQTEVLDLLRLSVGADVTLGRVHLGISGVEAQAQLRVRLDNVAMIINRVLTTLDRHPEILRDLARGVGSAVQDVGGGARQAVGEVGTGAGRAVQDVGRGAGAAVRDVGHGVGSVAEDVGRGAGTAVQDVGRDVGRAVEDVGGEAGRAAVGTAGEEAGDGRSRPEGRRPCRLGHDGRHRTPNRVGRTECARAGGRAPGPDRPEWERHPQAPSARRGREAAHAARPPPHRRRTGRAALNGGGECGAGHLVPVDGPQRAPPLRGGTPDSRPLPGHRGAGVDEPQ